MKFWQRRKAATEEQAHEITVQDSMAAMRVVSGLSREEVADRIGCTVEAVLEFERGETDPTLAQVRRYAHAVGVLTRWQVSVPREMEEVTAE